MEKIVKNYCRICLEKTNDGFDLFSDRTESKTFLRKIFTCFQIKLLKENSLPHMICTNCLNELDSANSFKTKCQTFGERFALLFENVKNISLPLTYHEAKEPFHTFQNSQEFHTTPEINICNSCGKMLKTKTSLLKHMVSMHQKRKHNAGKVIGFGVNRKYQCTICTYSTPHSQTLVNHMRIHNGERPHHCHCGKSFTQSSGLAAHLKTHSDTKHFTCTKCGKQFKHAYTLKRHFIVHETGKFKCNICHKGLKSKQSLHDHLQRHYNLRSYSCEECGNTFVTSSELIHHKQKHISDKKLECHLCSYRTHEKKSMILHLKRHAGDKAFKCKFCEVTFYTQGEARRHQRVHTRDKPFPCPTCSQRFSYSPSLNKHMLSVHGVEYKWGDIKSLKKEIKALSE